MKPHNITFHLNFFATAQQERENINGTPEAYSIYGLHNSNNQCIMMLHTVLGSYD